MSAPQAGSMPLLARLGERINPLVVKEVRQGLRTRVFWVCFTLMLAACLLLSLWASVRALDGVLTANGQEFFFAYYVCLGVVHFFVIPYTAYRSLAREREDETWVLLVLTGMGPRRILRGKVASFLVQAALYASAAGPFLLFSYYLNGIDLPSILLVLVLGAAWLAFLTVLSVCAATLADGRMVRALVHFLVLGVLGTAVFQGLLGAYALSEEGERLMRDRDVFYPVLASALWLMLGYGWLLFEAAASRLALMTEDYSRGPRRALALHMVVSALLVWVLWDMNRRPQELAVVAGVLGTLHLVGCGLFVATDVDGQARALRAGTRPWSVLRPGALRGLRFILLLVAAWTAFCVAMHQLAPRTEAASRAMLMCTLSIAAYGVLFLSLALVVGRLPRSDRFASPMAVRVLFLVLVGLFCALPPLFAMLMGLRADDGLVNLLNPLVGTVNFGTHRGYYNGTESPGDKMTMELLAFVAGVALLAAFAADRTLAERERRAHGS
ncbi:ABC transporter permease [Myxococcaceae bacterium GXIMD 01537]